MILNLSRFLSRSVFVLTLVVSTLFALLSVQAQAEEEPKITIYHTEDKTFYEYTREGEVVEIKVVPKKGEPYYLIPNGGADEGFRRATESKLRVPTWVIFSW